MPVTSKEKYIRYENAEFSILHVIHEFGYDTNKIYGPKYSLIFIGVLRVLLLLLFFLLRF